MVAEVREKYGRIAAEGGSCCGPNSCGGTSEVPVSLGIGYSPEELAALPEGANLGLGCGAPLAALAPRRGETVLDLGSGAGIDVLLAARAVGEEGRAIGIDMTPEMLKKARANAAKVGAWNAEFREGRLEELPVASASVDAVTSNCVINLVPDKSKVFAEVARVLRPGGRLVISDIVLDGALPERIERDVYAYVGCISGAALRERYFGWLRAAGFAEIEVLKDVDYLAMLKDTAPEEAGAVLERTGTKWEEIEGRVRSITFRARKAA
ncbi:MAG: arsenite methyltransferase [Vicinamibacteria bacterium]|nr:arsenite methyltransferase [Vicinamibacteria bacterium]